jgi:hypothetical protein
MSIQERLHAIQKLMLSAAVLVAAIAALVFALGTATARADSGDKGNGRYQFFSAQTDTKDGFQRIIMDTSTGFLWISDSDSKWRWVPFALDRHFDPNNR